MWSRASYTVFPQVQLAECTRAPKIMSDKIRPLALHDGTCHESILLGITVHISMIAGRLQRVLQLGPQPVEHPPQTVLTDGSSGGWIHADVRLPGGGLSFLPSIRTTAHPPSANSWTAAEQSQEALERPSYTPACGSSNVLQSWTKSLCASLCTSLCFSWGWADKSPN